MIGLKLVWLFIDQEDGFVCVSRCSQILGTSRGRVRDTSRNILFVTELSVNVLIWCVMYQSGQRAGMCSPTSPAVALQRKSLKEGVPAQEVAQGLGGDWFVVRLLSGAVTETIRAPSSVRHRWSGCLLCL